MKKKYLIFFLVPLIFLSFSLNAFAQSFSAYGSVTNSTSQVQTLTGYFLNSDQHKWEQDFIIIRTGEYQYDLFCGSSLSGTVHDFRLTRQSSNYNSEWIFSEHDISNFSYSLGNYTAVGNVAGSIKSSEYQSQRMETMCEIFLIIIIILLAIRIFRFGGHKIELR